MSGYNMTHTLDYSMLIKRLNKVLDRYDEHAVLQNEIADRLLEQLQYMKLQPQRIVDISFPCKKTKSFLKKTYPDSEIISLSNGFNAGKEYLNARLPSLSIEGSSVDLIVSNMQLHYHDDLNVCFHECARILKPQGLFLFSLFGPDSYQELYNAFSTHDEVPHVHDFVDMHHIGDILVNNALIEPVVNRQMLMLHYDDIKLLVDDLRYTGLHNIRSDRRKSLLGKQRWQKVIESYQKHAVDKKLPVTIEFIVAHAWKANQKETDGEVLISVDSLKRN